jgi:hypothetical protein
MAVPRNFISLPDACLRLKLQHGLLYRMLLAGEVRGVRNGHRWLVALADVQRLERLRRHPDQSATPAA